MELFKEIRGKIISGVITCEELRNNGFVSSITERQDK